MAPALRRPGLYWLADPKNYVAAETAAKFPRALPKHWRGRMIVGWDGGSNHQGELSRARCAQYPRLHPERLPAYAPELNPVEPVWSHLKCGRTANFGPGDLLHLDRTVRSHLQNVSRTPPPLQSLWRASALPFPPSIFT